MVSTGAAAEILAVVAATLGTLPLLVARVQSMASAVPDAKRWEHELSGAEPSPRIQFGQLENGLRYAWMVNGAPAERSYLRLQIDAGSLHERDGEQGMAHFVEHLAFNGTRHFPAGELVKWFQEHGMDFGADVNAFTGYGQTVYQIDVPTSDVETLREGLAVLRDYADGILFEEDEIAAEQGVVDSEERVRDGAMMRIAERYLELHLAGTRVPERSPIGTPEARAAFDAAACRAFYRRWYRPDNATLVLVGDLGELHPVSLFEDAFGTWDAGSEPLEPEPELGTPTLENTEIVIPEPELSFAILGAGRVSAGGEIPMTPERLVLQLPLVFARAMLDRRFENLAKRESAPFLHASADGSSAGEGDSPFPTVTVEEGLSVVCSGDDWKRALAAAERELRRALEFGFQRAELDEVRERFLGELERQVKREGTRASLDWLGEIMSAVEHRTVPMSPEARRDLLAPAARVLAVEQCRAAYARAWGRGRLVLQLAGNYGSDPVEGRDLRAVWESSRATEVEPPDALESTTFAYSSEKAEPADVEDSREIDDLGIRFVRFENGVQLAVKATDFKTDEVLVYAALGEGALTLDPAEYALAPTATAVFDQGGLEQHSEEELKRILAGRVAGVSFWVGGDRFFFGGPTSSDDVGLQCELMCAYLEHPGWRSDGLTQYRSMLVEQYEWYEVNHGGPLAREFIPALYGGDPRFGAPEREVLESVEMAELRAWLEPQLAEAPLSVAIVGDVVAEDVVDAVAKTFGRLPARAAAQLHAERRKISGPRSGVDIERSIPTEDETALVVVTFPTTDGRSAETRSALELLGRILDDRVRIRIREELGASYSPGAYAKSGTVYDGDGMLWVHMSCEPDAVEGVVTACFELTDSLAANGVLPEEVERLRGPVRTREHDARRTNEFWQETLLGWMHTRPAALDEVRGAAERLESLRKEQLDALAARYLRRELSSRLVVLPEERDGEQ